MVMSSKLARLVGVVFCVAFCVICSAQTWLLQLSNGEWERFSTEVDWRKAAAENQPLETAVISRTGAGVTVVYDVQGESGDWRNVDRYLFRPSGALIRLKRTFGSAAQHIRLIQIFVLERDGVIRKTFESETSLNSGKPKKNRPEIPQMSVVSNLDQLEFARNIKH